MRLAVRDPYYFENGSHRQGALLLVVHTSQEPAFQREQCLYFARVRPGAKQAKYAVATTAAPKLLSLQNTIDRHSQEGATASHQASAVDVRFKKQSQSA